MALRYKPCRTAASRQPGGANRPWPTPSGNQDGCAAAENWVHDWRGRSLRMPSIQSDCGWAARNRRASKGVPHARPHRPRNDISRAMRVSMTLASKQPPGLNGLPPGPPPGGSSGNGAEANFFFQVRQGDVTVFLTTPMIPADHGERWIIRQARKRPGPNALTFSGRGVYGRCGTAKRGLFARWPPVRSSAGAGMPLAALPACHCGRAFLRDLARAATRWPKNVENHRNSTLAPSFPSRSIHSRSEL